MNHAMRTRVMAHGRFSPRLTALLAACCIGAGALVGCSSYSPPEPTPLQANPASVPMQTAWQQQIGEVRFPLQIAVVAGQAVLADSTGQVMAVQPETGAVQWQVAVGDGLAAGVGSDGTTAAVVTVRNQLVALRGGKVAWRMPLSASSSTAPLVDGGMVYVLTDDGKLSAFDAATGQRGWQQVVRSASSTLTVRQPSVLLRMGPAVLAGVAGRTVALDWRSGQMLGEATLSTTRAPGDIGRASVVLAPAARHDAVLCARTFGVDVGCLDYGRGVPLWSQPSRGSYGLGGDAHVVVGADDSGEITAWARADGKTLWSTPHLRYRNLGAPLVTGHHVIVGDAQGVVHMLDVRSGLAVNRITLNGAAHTIAPVQAGQYVLTVSRKGQIQAIHLP